ncbi:MAG: DUF4395 family protein [Burkholderiales bacterium]|nr:DUF4395 family protein [Burkholderiales bacterium]
MDTARELQFGPGLRVQRLAEAAFLVAAIFTQDIRFAWVTFAFTLLQVLSPRWALVAQAVARFARFRGPHRIGDMYFDLGGSRGACALSVVVQATCLALVEAGLPLAGFVLLTVPTASFLIAPTLGFCAGCWFYVLGRDWCSRHGWLKGSFHDHHDIAVDGEEPRHQPALRPSTQR